MILPTGGYVNSSDPIILPIGGYFLGVEGDGDVSPVRRRRHIFHR